MTPCTNTICSMTRRFSFSFEGTVRLNRKEVNLSSSEKPKDESVTVLCCAPNVDFTVRTHNFRRKKPQPLENTLWFV